MEQFAINESTSPVSYWQGEDGQNLLTTIHNFKTKQKGTNSVHSTHIQSDSGGICITLGNDSISDSKQKSSYEHGSDFERLRSYGHFLIPIHALM